MISRQFRGSLRPPSLTAVAAALRYAFIVSVSSSGAALAQDIAQASTTATAGSPAAVDAQAFVHGAVRPGERLSDWLIRQPSDLDAYPAGLVWGTPSASTAQAQLKQGLLAQLWTGAELQAPAEARKRLSDWIRDLPVTGRVPLEIPDAYWLQGHPAKDPVLRHGDTVIRPNRPGTITVITDQGERCELDHAPGAHARSYLQACLPLSVAHIDQAWVVQPDGRVSKYPVASWNETEQNEVAPGAWIWAPARNAGWSEAFSDKLATFLATQGPSGVPQTPAHRHAPDVLPALTPGALLPAPAPRDPMLTANDWGFIGLLQTPTARMAPAGELRFHLSRVYPYTRGSVVAQPFDWLEAGFRYSSISNRLYGPNIAGDQSYKDKSIDFKLRLTEETATWPQIAFGMTDIGGTGLFSGEYLVASKRTGNFDWSLGFGWGYIGNAGRVRNPFNSISDAFAERTVSANVSRAGSIDTSSFFSGRTSFFGGVQYRTPSDKWLLKLEYDGNDYRNEPFANTQKQRSPFNIGAVYRYAKGLDLHAGLERGNTLQFGLTLRGDIGGLFMPKLLDPDAPSVLETRPQGTPNWQQMAAEFSEQTQWQLREIRRHGTGLQLIVEEPYGIYQRDRLDRAIAVLHRHAPAEITRFIVSFHERGLPLTDWTVLREEWVAQKTRYRALADHFEAVVTTESWFEPNAETVWAGPANTFELGLEPSYAQNIGGPDGFILYQLGVAAPTQWRLSENTWLSGRLNLRVLDNFDKFKYDGPSNLPRVRTNLRQYMTTSRLTLPNLQLNHVRELGRDQYASVYGGYLEPMFAGIGAEWLYRPWNSDFAFGLDINRVRQRAFEQDFALQKYQATTGHATLYWDTGWQNVLVSLSAGQYLAGDRGVTLDVQRRFDNGVAMGLYATKTNVSSAEFGEGSFDKGIYLQVPFDAMLPFSSTQFATVVWNPLTRDGGARLWRSLNLYNLTFARDRRAGRYAPAGSAAWQQLQREQGEERSIWGELGHTGSWLGKHIFSRQALMPLLAGTGITAASTVLDKPVSRWADSHQGGGWDTAGKAASAIPFILGAGTAALWMGLGDEAASDTARTALISAGWTLGIQTLAKYAIGRARPEEGLGPNRFSGFKGKAADSSFPSTHMGVAFALVTPFAQRYDAPWLYAVAGATAFGRIQERKHFVSDVVAGGLIGYGIGSLLLGEQRSRNAPAITVGPDRSLHAHWQF